MLLREVWSVFVHSTHKPTNFRPRIAGGGADRGGDRASENVGVGKITGSIYVGKIADLVLVEEDTSKRIGDLRNTRTVMMGGKLMDADALRSAGGFSRRPATQ